MFSANTFEILAIKMRSAKVETGSCVLLDIWIMNAMNEAQEFSTENQKQRKCSAVQIISTQQSLHNISLSTT